MSEMVCSKCGYGAAEHALEGHPASRCIAGMVLKEAPLPALWQRIEERLTGTLAEGLAAIRERARAADEPSSLLRVLLDLELAALEMARDEMRRDGMIPSMTAGRMIWFDTAKAISGYLRERIGLPAGEPGGGV